MKQFAVIGDPISQSLSPILHHEIYGQLGLNASFDKIHVKKHELLPFIKSHQLDGFNVTIPHKQSIIPYLDDLDDAAKTIGAVNCVHQGKGYNTDWIGFSTAMVLNQIELNGASCIILGAGGAARAIVYALNQGHVKSISVLNRTPDKAMKICQWIESISTIPTTVLSPTHQNTLTNEHIVINCTPLGMWPEMDTTPNIDIQKEHILIDTIYNPIETTWLKKGQQVGAKTVGGLDMFIAQGLASADRWFGEKVSEKIELEPIKKVLKSELC